MSIKTGKVNPLNVLGQRKVLFPAHHFHYTEIQKNRHNLAENISEWIYYNLNSRYYVGSGFSVINNEYTYTIQVGFEQEKELSFFKLACPLLN